MLPLTLTPGIKPHRVGKADRNGGINMFQVSRPHLDETLLRATAAQQRFNLVGELLPCSDCLESKGRKAGVPRGPGGRAIDVIKTVYLDLAESCTRTVGGSYFMLACVDSKSRFIRI